MTPISSPRVSSGIDGPMERRRKVEVCPMQRWLNDYGFSQSWLADEMGLSKNQIYMWFARRPESKAPSAERIREMARLTKGAVTVAELRTFFEKGEIVRRRMPAKRRS